MFESSRITAERRWELRGPLKGVAKKYRYPYTNIKGFVHRFYGDNDIFLSLIVKETYLIYLDRQTPNSDGYLLKWTISTSPLNVQSRLQCVSAN